MRKLNNLGFGLVEFAVIVMIIGLVCGLSFYVYRTNNPNTKNPSSSSESNQKGVEGNEKSVELNTISLGGRTVQLSFPSLWVNNGIGCYEAAPAWEGKKYIDSTVIYPDKVPDNGFIDPYIMRVDVCLFDNPTNEKASEWINGPEGSFNKYSGSDEEAQLSIGGYDVYYRRVDSTYVNVTYVVAHESKILYLSSRLTVPKAETVDSSGKIITFEEADFRSYEPEIRKIVESVKFP